MPLHLLQGHAPAGGCLLALSCDYRLMAKEKYTIGLNGAHLVRFVVIVANSIVFITHSRLHNIGHSDDTPACSQMLLSLFTMANGYNMSVSLHVHLKNALAKSQFHHI